MAVIKVYSRINWLNKSESLTTPLGKTNLNKMDKAIDIIDDEVVSISSLVETLDTTKVSADQLNNMVTDVSFNDKNGVISITKYNGTTLNIDTAIEKIAVNFEYSAQTQQLIITLESGEKQYIDMSALITQYEFKDTDTIAFSIDSSGKVSASIKNGSITKAMLSSEVMASITLSENNAAASAKSAEQSATNADMDAKLSQSYSVGKSGIREGEDTDNSKYYSEQAKKYADEAQEIAGGNFIPKSEKGIAGGIATLNDNLAVEKAVSDEDGNNIKETYAKKTEISQAIDVDTELSETSTNPVENKAIAEAINNSNKKIANLEENKADKKETTVNLLNPTLQTTTQNGVTCTNKGDGSLSFSGTSTANTYFAFDVNKYLNKGKYNLVGEKKDGTNLYITKENDFGFVLYSGIIEVNDSTYYRAVLEIQAGTPLDNFVLRPMLTTNLNATYDDFVPYTGNTGQLNSDVAEIRKEYATKTEVPLLVKVDNKTVFISSDGTLSAKGGGSSIKPKSVSNASIVTDKGQVTIKWTDPTDIVVDGATLSQWQKTVLVYKQGTTAPTSINDGTVAVTETTRNQYQTSGYTITGLTDGNDYSFSLFAISTDGTSSDATNLTAKLYANLTITTEEASLYGKKVTVTKGSNTVTGTFSNSGSVTIKVPWTGETTVTASDGADITSATVNIVEYSKSYTAELSFFKIVTFADGTDEEITAMIEAHYNNKINIADYWAVGDKRKVNLSAMAATGVNESHRAQTVEFAIADFEHDDLTTAINGHTKVAITLTQVDCLMDAANSSNPVNGSTNTENGYMNSTNTNIGGWKDCARRTWCNDVYLKALPSTWQNIVKTVNKKSGIGNGSSSGTEITADKIFLLAEIEVFGSITYSVSGEGTQYQYYKNATANRYKMPKWSSSNGSNLWLERSPRSGSTGFFCCVSYSGNANSYSAHGLRGVSPCLCI